MLKGSVIFAWKKYSLMLKYEQAAIFVVDVELFVISFKNSSLQRLFNTVILTYLLYETEHLICALVTYIRHRKG